MFAGQREAEEHRKQSPCGSSVKKYIEEFREHVGNRRYSLAGTLATLAMDEWQRHRFPNMLPSSSDRETF